MSDSLFDLSGRTALVTGSSRGLGLVLAKGLAEAGAGVILNGRDAAVLSAAVDSLRDAGFDAHGRSFDVTDAAGIESSVAAIEGEVGPIDILVNNAGIQRRAALETMMEDEWATVLATNLTSVFLVGQAVGKRMIQRKRGKIVNICSLMSEVARPSIANYSAAKGGLKMLTRAIAVEWGAHNIQCNGIGPGYFRTEMTQSLYDDESFRDKICKRTPAGRWGEPGDLVGTAVFLASSASDFVNGQIIYVDGGILAGL